VYNSRMINSSVRHCFSCGNSAMTRFIEGRDRQICSVCGIVLYQNPYPASAVLLVQNGRILLVKRGMEPQKGLWALPAGYQEHDETPEQAARREMHEETGLMAGKLQLFDLVYNDFNPYRPINVAVFLTEEAEGVLTPGDDVTEAGFFPLNQLPTQLAFNYIPHCLKRLALTA
jgi:8-oxo-dGTP diphosphatase